MHALVWTVQVYRYCFRFESQKSLHIPVRIDTETAAFVVAVRVQITWTAQDSTQTRPGHEYLEKGALKATYKASQEGQQPTGLPGHNGEGHDLEARGHHQ